MKKRIAIITFILFTLFVNSQSMYFPPNSGTTWESTTPESLNICQRKIDSLYNFLDSNNSKAFILLKDGKIVLEKYFGTHTATSNWYWASAGKTITSLMVGIAQQEQLLNINDLTSEYLGKGWTNASVAQEDLITIKNQLSMTSGLDDAVSDPYCTSSSCLLFKANAGSRWAYHNGPYTLLDQVIENATGLSYNNYVTAKLKTKTGMTGAFVQTGSNNVFYSNARSMARFGLLILNQGNWNGDQVITDSNYFYQMTHPSQNINKSYGYLWWLNGYESYMVPQTQFVFNGMLAPNAPTDMICALGKNGQFINVVPSQNLVWLRMGDSPNGDEVPFELNDKIWTYINAFNCNALSTAKLNSSSNHFLILPNPANDSITLRSDHKLGNIAIFNLNGQKVYAAEEINNEALINVSLLTKGVYIVKVTNDKNVFTSKFVKQ